MSTVVNVMGILTLMFLFGSNHVLAQEVDTKVSVATVMGDSVKPKISIPGNLFSRSDLEITTGVEGQLNWVIEPGTYVNAGDVLARIDDTDLLLERARLEAGIERHRININYLNRDLLRLVKLQKNNNASVFQYEERKSQRDIAKADLKITELLIQQVNEQVNKTVILTPINGMVVERYLRENRDVNRGDSVLRLVDTKALEARVFIPLRYRPYIKKGAKVGISSSTRNGEAIIRSLIPASNALSQTFEARLDLLQSHTGWTVGESVNVILQLNQQRNQIAVPRDALVIREEGIYVVRVNKEQVAEQVFVKVGQGDEYWISVEGALKQGDKVVVRGAEGLASGQQVLVI